MRKIAIAERDGVMRNDIARSLHNVAQISVFDGYGPILRGLPHLVGAHAVVLGDAMGTKIYRSVEALSGLRKYNEAPLRILVTVLDPAESPCIAFGLRDQTIQYIVKYPIRESFFEEFLNELLPDPFPVARVGIDD
jgi:hypothetical protein